MTCPACGHENRLGAKFCEECGAKTGAKPAKDAAEAAHTAGARKVVTIIFADLVGSTALHERLDPESARAFMERYYGAMRAALGAHGGTIAKLLGDGVMAVFGVPLVAEDDAIRAVRAAVAMQVAFRALVDEQGELVGKTGLRVAVNTGEVVAQDASELLGDPVNVAARLQEQGRDGDVVIGEATQRLVASLVTLAPLGSFTLKGRAEAVKVYRVVSLERPASVTTAAFVGRADELARLTAVYDAAVAAPAARLAVLVGSPGLGKSRLIAEQLERLDAVAAVLTAHCDATGGATFAPLARAFREHLGIDDATSGEGLRAALAAAVPSNDADHVRILDGIAALLVGSPAAPEETFFVVRRFLAALAAARPVVLVIDDLHWAEPLLLDLVEHLVQWGSGVPLLVLVGARPELRDVRASLVTPGGLVAEVVTLAGLDAGAAMRLAANVIGAADLPAAVAAKVLATSEGNPLFVGELVRMLVHEGALQREGDRWIVGAGLGALEMPPTIHALLAARLERLRPDERGVLERAAVVGRQFSRSAIVALLGPRGTSGLAVHDLADLDARLESLRWSELIEPDTGWFLGEPALRFHHVLIRDVAYRRLLKGTRAELHGRLADWIEARAGDAVEHDETIGWHLEQAHQCLRELGPLDAAGKSFGGRASHRLAAAGRRALARDDLSLAANLLGRALACLDAGDPARADLALDWCEAVLSAGDVGTAADAIAELGRFVAASDRLRAWQTCFTGQLTALTQPEALRDTADAVAAAADVLAALGDAAGEAKAHAVHAQALARLGRVGGAEAALDRALAAARRAGDRRRANAVLAGAPLAALWGPSPVTRASGRCLDVVRVLRITQGAPAVEAVALSCQGVLEALRGRAEAARRMIGSARKMVEELGISHRLFEADVFAARVDLLEGDATAAERSLRGAYDGLRDLGLGIDAAQAAALLARALLAQGRAAEAEALSHESELLAGDDLQAAIAWRGVRAEALARRGEHAAAVELAEAAVAIAAATDALLDHADARLALAAAFRAADRGPEADAEERRANDLWEAKGAVLLAERARGDGRPPAPRAPAREDRAQPPVDPARRRVRATAALRQAERLAAAMAAADVAAVSDLIAADVECLHHPTGASWEREALLTLNAQVLSARNLQIRTEYLATLGDALLLFREWSSWEALEDDTLDQFGAVERERIILTEVDASGRQRRVEFFAADHLGDAIARLYGRHAEQLPAGAARDRAATTASAVATVLSPDLERYGAALAPDVEFHDHRTLGFGSGRGADELARAVTALVELADGFTIANRDVLRLEANALLVHGGIVGTDRASGGTFELPALNLFVFGPDGRADRYEAFDVEREVEALARFDELTGASASAAPRRVRPNAATANGEGMAAAIASRDVDAFGQQLSDDFEMMHYPTGASYGRRGMLTTWRSILRATHLTYRPQVLATLGDSLTMIRHRLSIEGLTEEHLASVGTVEMDEIILIQVDEHGRCRFMDLFVVEHLGAAFTRLYERYAELLPAGAARERAAATARSVAVMASFAATADGERLSLALSPTFQIHDRRRLVGAEPGGAAALTQGARTYFDLAQETVFRFDDLRRLEAHALLARVTYAQIPMLMLWVFGADGLMIRWEGFDVECEAEAHARLDELTVPAPRPVTRRLRPTAASGLAARFAAAFAAGDADAIAALWTDDLEVLDHPNAASYGRDGHLASIRRLQRARDPKLSFEPLATLGESLCLTRRRVATQGTAGGRFDVGASEHEVLVLFEVDARGRCRRVEIFAAGHLEDAVVRLYARSAELLPDGPAHARAAATARAVAGFEAAAAGDLDRSAAALSPTIELVDHRTLGLPPAHGADEALRIMRSLFDLAAGVSFRAQDILGLEPDGHLLRRMLSGTDRTSGGAVESPGLDLSVFARDGLLVRYEIFDVDREAEALARFDALVGGAAAASAGAAAATAPLRIPPNAAVRARERALTPAFAARDWSAVRGLVSADFTFEDGGKRALVRGDVETWIASMEFHATEPGLRRELELIGTFGDRIALERMLWTKGPEHGALETEHLHLLEVDADGRVRTVRLFDPDDRGAADREAFERFAAGEAAASAGVAAFMRFGRALVGPAWVEEARESLASDLVLIDHRPLGFGALDRERWIASIRALDDPSISHAWDVSRVLAWNDHGLVVAVRGFGILPAGGGPFENVWYGVVLNAGDRIQRYEMFAERDAACAVARFEELCAARAG